MPSHEVLDKIKRRLRKLKKLEIKIRFEGSFHASNYSTDFISGNSRVRLVWYDFFHLGDNGCGKARYNLVDMATMDKDEYKNVIDEFFFNVYYRYYTENGITGSHLYDPELLSRMGLSPDASSEDIKKRFRVLAMKYHPDTGGEESKFIELMENYHKLVD